MVVEKGTNVSIEYEGKFEDGTVFDSSNRTGEQQPLEFVVGSGMVISGFDNAVLGMNEGEIKNFEVSPEEGYGPIRPELMQEIPKSSLPQDKQPEVGMVLLLKNQQGQQFPVKIAEVKESSVVLDMNHPLAGKKLLFSIKVVGLGDSNIAAA